LIATLLISPFVHAACFRHVGKRFHISPLLLEAIARKESHMYNHAINTKNNNNTEDVCMMGVNSSHYKKLASLGITRQRLLTDPCVCVAAGAWVLNGFFEHYGRSWDTVGMYNTGPNPRLKQLRMTYADDIRHIFNQLAREQSVRPDAFGHYNGPPAPFSEG